MRLQLILFSIFMLCCSCSRHKTEQETVNIDTIPMMVMQIQKCSKLYTAEYKVHKIITHDDKMKLNGSFMKKRF